MSAVHDIHITICMGSSCFARGNNRNIEVLKELADHSPPGVRCCLSGRLCEGQCTLGPNLVIEGKMHHGIDPVSVMTLVYPQLNAQSQTESPPGSEG
jgi:NADH:ubiquinone oxidoreductase subunit E